MTVDPNFVSWLKQPALYAVSSVAGAAAAWGDKATTSSVVSPLRNQADAAAMAVTQAAFMAGPLPQDKAIIPGLRSDLIGKCITLKGDRLGYEAGGVPVFVIGASENEQSNTTTITVLKKAS